MEIYQLTCHPESVLPLQSVLPHGAVGQGFSVPQARKFPGQLLCGRSKVQRDCVPARALLSVCSNSSVQLHQDKAWECYQQLRRSTLHEVLTELLTSMSDACSCAVCPEDTHIPTVQCLKEKAFICTVRRERLLRGAWLRRAWLIPSSAGVCLFPSGCHWKMRAAPFWMLLWD